MLPNFRFNHSGLEVRREPDLVLGELVVRTGDDGMVLHRSDSTSGESWFARVGGGEEFDVRMNVALPNADAVAVAIRLEHGPAETEVRLRIGAFERSVGRVRAGEPIVFGPAIFAGAGELRGRTFAAIGSDWALRVGLRAHRVDTAVMDVSGVPRALDCVAIWGPRSAPTYWWIDREGRVVAMTSALWTYVQWSGRPGA
jgi:hypothetical protein